MRETIEIGYQAFVSDGGEEFGAVREVSPNGGPELVIYVENAGVFVVPLAAVEAVHSTVSLEGVARNLCRVICLQKQENSGVKPNGC